MMKKLSASSTKEPICRSAVGRLVVRHLMKHGARGSAEEILDDAAEILRRKVRDRTATDVLERSVANRQVHLHLHSMLKHRAVGGSVRLLEDFRGKAVAAIVNAATEKSGAGMARRLAAAILESYADSGPAPRGRTRAAARLAR
jgi:ribosomal protein S7